MCFVSISIDECLYRHTMNTAGTTIHKVSLLSEKKTRSNGKLIIDVKSEYEWFNQILIESKNQIHIPFNSMRNC
jgi:hypothetical protein